MAVLWILPDEDGYIVLFAVVDGSRIDGSTDDNLVVGLNESGTVEIVATR